jgi:hypothetical protein
METFGDFMKYLFVLALLFASLSYAYQAQAQVHVIGQSPGSTGAGYVAGNEGVYLSWRGDSGAKYTILRRTEDTPYEVISEDAKMTMGTFLDSTAEMNTTYYYLITTSIEMKLFAATKLLDSFDVSQPLLKNNTTHKIQNGSIILTPGPDGRAIYKNTGVKLDKSKYYELRIDFGDIKGKGGMLSFNLSGLNCAGQVGTAQMQLYGEELLGLSNKSYYCRIRKLVTTNPRAEWYYDSNLTIFVNTWQKQNYSVEIKKIELFVEED